MKIDNVYFIYISGKLNDVLTLIQTGEIRDSAIQLVLNSDEEIKNLAEDLGVNPKTLYNWVYNYKRENNLQTYHRSNGTKSKIAKCMKEVGISVKMKRKFKEVTTNSNHNYSISPNRLQRDFRANVADEVYVGDITYIRTQQGWLYLAVVIDLFSRKVVGWSMDDNMQVSLVNNALQMALYNRKPQSQLIWHTDRGFIQRMATCLQ